MPGPRRGRAVRTARLVAAALVVVLVAGTPAQATIEDSYTTGEPPITTTWYAWRSDAAQEIDRAYVAGMRPHHAGALTMSAAYLAEPGRSSPLLQQLARAIVVNQRFEIAVLDEVTRNLDQPPLRLPFGLRLQPVATEGMTGVRRFFREPIPSPASYPVGMVSEADVRFAKAMILHHEGALEMARGYHEEPRATNGFLGLINVDIVTDQTQEIALMRRVIAAYRGDASAIVVDPAMVHGIEGMRHGAGGHGAAAAGAAAGPGAAMPAAHDHAGHGAAVPAPGATLPVAVHRHGEHGAAANAASHAHGHDTRPGPAGAARRQPAGPSGHQHGPAAGPRPLAQARPRPAASPPRDAGAPKPGGSHDHAGHGSHGHGHHGGQDHAGQHGGQPHHAAPAPASAPAPAPARATPRPAARAQP